MKKKNTVVLGTQWDEGKGKIVDLLTDNADAVVRFQSGHNAGHTLIINGQKTVYILFHQESSEERLVTLAMVLLLSLRL